MAKRSPRSAPQAGKLTANQAAFVERYLASMPRNATAAYRDVYGGSDNAAGVGGHRLLRNPKVIAEIERREAAVSRPFGLTAKRIRRELAAVAFSDVRHYTFDDEGRLVLAKGAPRGAMRAVRSVKFKRRAIARAGVDAEGKPLPPIFEVEAEIRLWDKPAALRLGAQVRGMLEAEQPDDDAPPLPEEIRVKLIEAHDGRPVDTRRLPGARKVSNV